MNFWFFFSSSVYLPRRTPVLLEKENSARKEREESGVVYDLQSLCSEKELWFPLFGHSRSLLRCLSGDGPRWVSSRLEWPSCGDGPLQVRCPLPVSTHSYRLRRYWSCGPHLWPAPLGPCSWCHGGRSANRCSFCFSMLLLLPSTALVDSRVFVNASKGFVYSSRKQ